MKACYTIRISPTKLAIADLVDSCYGEGLILTRINVPSSERGKGLGTKLLRMVLADADKASTTLWLEACPSGGLTYDQLTSWYARHGFQEEKFEIMRREPRPC